MKWHARRRRPTDYSNAPRHNTPQGIKRRAIDRRRAEPHGVTVCPVCATPLVVEERVEQRPHGPEKIYLLHCPNDACPRSRMGESGD